ncbi:MAG TPA: GNAT family N-acetyltransferase [Bacteriovoracaceae bacterium]|nr:GNAT family N-acetyltransferase [Bacteriovoracaceae bacterium]
MGKNFPRITTLRENPSCVEETIHLIEKSFHYPPAQSFKIDFAPLIEKENHHNCFILVDENEKVLAHIGVKERNLQINNQLFNICMLGGIAVDENHRGQGHFQLLLQDVLAEKRSDTCFFILWSDQEKLYSKYGFTLCGGQFELIKQGTQNKNLIQTSYGKLSNSQQGQIKELYQNSFAKTYQTLDRTETDWNLLGKITSADLLIEEKEGRIVNYFFMNKGQDLEGIIYEYGSSGDLKLLLEAARAYGKVWLGAPLIETEHDHYQFLMATGDLKHFTEFIHAYTQGLMEIRNINIMKQEVFFDFNQETLMLSTEEFLRGVMGPGPFEELGEIKPFFLSGLDSI